MRFKSCMNLAAGLLLLSSASCAQTHKLSAAPIAPPQGIALPLSDHINTSRYKIDINYFGFGANESRLRDYLRQVGTEAKRNFHRSLPDPRQFPELANRQFQLLIDFKLAARTNAFVSVRETGFQDTGGAHPAPIDAAIVYDIHAHRTITLDDLFSNPDAARKALADYARADLMKKIMAQAPKPGEGSPEAVKEWKANAKQMIDHGTQPTPRNFANFIVRATDNPLDPSPGLMLIFPPYQVAAYVYGTQTVFAPTAVFVQLLKPQYRNAFGIPIVN